MKGNQISDNDEAESFLVNEINNDKENEKKKEKEKQILNETEKKEYPINKNQKEKDDANENNNILNDINEDDDSNSLLTNNPIRLRLYLNPSKCFQLFKMNKIGKSFACFYNKNDDPIIIIGPQWPYCILLLFLVSLAFIFIYIYYNNKSTTFVKLSDWLAFIIWCFSYTMLCMRNPGYPKNCPESIKGTKEMSYCDKCEIWYKPSSSTIHCEICDICIEGYTHHCLWAGHCIGGINKKYFYLFLAISILFPIYLMFNIALIGKH